MTIKLIVAADMGNAVGWTDGDLAYRGLKKDMARFKELTTGHTVVMGRTTYLSLKRPNGLPNRRNIVLSRRPYNEIRGQIQGDVELVQTLDFVWRLDQLHPEQEFWIIGGASVYDEALEKGMVDEIYLTIVHATCEADVRLKTDLAAWKLFVIREATIGRKWIAIREDPELDGDFYTTLVHLQRTGNGI
jgi:dihydrofolate reductase